MASAGCWNVLVVTGSAAEEVAKFIILTAKSVHRLMLLEAAHTSDAPLDPALVLVQVDCSKLPPIPQLKYFTAPCRRLAAVPPSPPAGCRSVRRRSASDCARSPSAPAADSAKLLSLITSEFVGFSHPPRLSIPPCSRCRCAVPCSACCAPSAGRRRSAHRQGSSNCRSDHPKYRCHAVTLLLTALSFHTEMVMSAARREPLLGSDTVVRLGIRAQDRAR